MHIKIKSKLQDNLSIYDLHKCNNMKHEAMQNLALNKCLLKFLNTTLYKIFR